MHPMEKCYNGLSDNDSLEFNLLHVVTKEEDFLGPKIKDIYVSDDYAWVMQQIQWMKILSPEYHYYHKM